ncbi:hypothetical protein VNI00_001318 [Paramarasmius palmivorus]|uniref:VTT domain-containing protein n=1 Tax=Paramarasmius palmivorus TaxID=297713 RepID=A0AAW0E6V1_9AGAR
MYRSSQDTQEHEDESDLSLPLPASATKASFGDVLDQKPPKSSLQSRSATVLMIALPSPMHSFNPQQVHFPLFLVITLFPISTILVFISLRTLPISVSWPRTLTDLATLGRELHGYSQSGTWPLAHVVGVMAITAIWKHAWSIPGSVIWNVLAGALFSPAFATILLTLLTTIGSLCATLLAAPLAPFITHFFPKALDMTRSALEGDVVTATVSETDIKTSDSPPSSSHTSGAWVRLSILRLVGVVPWSGINIACGVCRVPLIDCLLGSFIGTLPWTAVTCQIGDILQTVASQPSPTPQTVSSLLVSPEIITKLVILSFLSLAPILAKDHLKALIASAPASASAMIQQEERKPRWSWKGVKEWKVRLPSRSRTRSRARDQLQLDLLIDEKRQIQMQDEALALPS